MPTAQELSSQLLRKLFIDTCQAPPRQDFWIKSFGETGIAITESFIEELNLQISASTPETIDHSRRIRLIESWFAACEENDITIWCFADHKSHALPPSVVFVEV